MQTKVENAAQKFVRARLMVEEAEELLELAKQDLIKLIPEGTRYTSKDGDVITHVSSSIRRSFVAEKLKTLLPRRIWTAVRIDAIDRKKLEAFIATGDLSLDDIREGVEETPVKSSLRVSFAPVSKKVA